MKTKIALSKPILSIVMCLALLLACLPLTAGAADADLSEDIVILYTNDVHTYIDGPLSYDVIAALKEELQEEYRYVLLADAGDHIQGTAYGSMDKGESIIELMNAAGYDVATLGNHEFDYAMQGCMNAIEWADFAYTSCNFYHEADGVRGENVLDSYVMFDCGDEKIAFVGITTPETFSKSTPAYFQDENGHFIYGISGGQDGSALQQDVQKAIDEAHNDGATQVIALGHLGADLSSSPWTSEETIAGVSGLDAFIDGHSHTVMESKEVKDKDGNDVLLTQTGEYFNRIGMMVIDAETGDMTTDFIECTGNEEEGYTLTSALYSGTVLISDETVKSIQSDWIQEIDEKLGEKIGSTAVTFDNYDSDGNRLVRSQETNSGDFAADALYYLFDDRGLDVDVAIMNGGGIRNKAVTGDISYKACKDIHTFGNVACLQTVTGQQLLDALEWGAKSVGVGENGGFLQVSGITYRIDRSIPDTMQRDEKDTWTGGPTGDYRVYDVMVYNKDTDSWDELDLDANYNLAGYNYTLRDLGDGFAMFDGAVNVLDYVMEDYLVLANYIQGFENGVVEACNSPLLAKYSGLIIDYSDVNGSGRIAIDTEIWVGEVKVTEDNADDVLGDGTVSYDAATNTLTLNGAEITGGYECAEDRIAGIYADGELNLALIGENTVTAPDSGSSSAGMYIVGDLNISGSGALTANGGLVRSQNAEVFSAGIFVTGGLTIAEATVTANGRDVVSSGPYDAVSWGVSVTNGLAVDFDGSLIATAANVQGGYAYSIGLYVDASEADEANIAVYDGCLDVEGGEAIGTVSACSLGVYSLNSGVYLYEDEAEAFIASGNATVSAGEEEDYAVSNGIYIYQGDLGMEAGNLTVSSGQYSATYGNAYAIYLVAGTGEDEEGNTYTVGGNFTVACDEVKLGTYSPILLGTTVTIKAQSGRAIYAQTGIDIGDKLTLSVPENGEIRGVGGSTDPENWSEPDYWTIVEADGDKAQEVIIKPLGYTVFLKGLSYGMGALVPVGQSINEAYCERYKVDDFSEILNTNRDGYTFGGWYTDEACTEGKAYDFDTPVTADVTLYAKWVPIANDEGDDKPSDSPDTGVGGQLALWFALAFVSGGVMLGLKKKAK